MRTDSCLWSLCAIALLSACGAPHSAEEDRDSGPERASTVIGPAGGTIRLTRGEAKGASIVIPPGALASPVTITMQQASLPNDIPKHLRAAGPLIDFGPDGLVFLKPVTVTLPANRRANVVYQRSSRGQWSQVFSAFRGSPGMWVAHITHFTIEGSYVDLTHVSCPAMSAPQPPAPTDMMPWNLPVPLDQFIPGGDEVDPTAPQIELKTKSEPPADDLNSFRDPQPPVDVLSSAFQLPAQVFPNGPRGARSKIAQFIENPTYLNAPLNPTVAMVIPSFDVKDENGVERKIFVLYPIATATLMKIPNKYSSNLLEVVSYPLANADYAYRSTHDNLPRHFAVVFGDLPESTHTSQFRFTGDLSDADKLVLLTLPYIDVPINQSDPPLMVPTSSGSKTSQPVPRFDRAFRVEPGQWHQLPSAPNPWPSQLNPVFPQHQRHLANAMGYIVLKDWVRYPFNDAPGPTVDVSKNSFPSSRPNFDPTNQQNPVRALVGTNIPTQATDDTAIDTWLQTSTQANGRQAGCGLSSGYGFTAANAYLKAPLPKKKGRPTEQLLEPQRSTEVEVFSPAELAKPSWINPPTIDMTKEYLGLSRSIFRYGDMGAPLIVTTNGTNTFLIGLCSYGDDGTNQPVNPAQNPAEYWVRFVKGRAHQTFINQGIAEANMVRAAQEQATGITWP